MENKTELIVIFAVILIAFSVSTIVVNGMSAYVRPMRPGTWSWRWPWETKKSTPAPTCTDSDGGRSYYAQGEIYVNGQPQTAANLNILMAYGTAGLYRGGATQGDW